MNGDREVSRYFTLVELLVVIAIISILAGLLLPALSRARQQARQSQCLSNQKNCGLAMLMYATENEEFFPLYMQQNATYGVSTGLTWGSWMVTQKYLGRSDATICPSAPPPSDENNTNWQLFTHGTLGVATGSGIGNFANKGLVNTTVRPAGASADDTYRGYVGTRLRQPSGAILLIDSMHKGQSAAYPVCKDWQYFSVNLRGYATTTAQILLPHLRHVGRVNAVFVDGHAGGFGESGYQRMVKDMFTGGNATGLANVQHLNQQLELITSVAWASI